MGSHFDTGEQETRSYRTKQMYIIARLGRKRFNRWGELHDPSRVRASLGRFLRRGIARNDVAAADITEFRIIRPGLGGASKPRALVVLDVVPNVHRDDVSVVTDVLRRDHSQWYGQEFHVPVRTNMEVTVRPWEFLMSVRDR